MFTIKDKLSNFSEVFVIVINNFLTTIDVNRDAILGNYCSDVRRRDQFGFLWGQDQDQDLSTSSPKLWQPRSVRLCQMVKTKRGICHRLYKGHSLPHRPSKERREPMDRMDRGMAKEN